jgi:FG-GAP-like repeat
MRAHLRSFRRSLSAMAARHVAWTYALALIGISALAFFAPILHAQSTPPRPNVAMTKYPSLSNVWPADLNEDGLTDLVAADSGQIVVMIGNGNGTFGAEQPFASAVGPLVPVTVGDFNGDGHVDLIAYNVVNSLPAEFYALHGAGNGTFNAMSHVASAGSVVTGITAELTGDGNRDFAVVAGRGQVAVYPGNGDFSFGTPMLLQTDYEPLSIIAGDFNADGRVDLATANNEGLSVDVFLNQGGLIFAPTEIPLDRHALGITARDMNGDGKRDLVVSTADRFTSVVNWWSSGYVYVLLGNGDGTFQSPLKYPTNRGPRTAVVGDFNGDGLVDVATGNQSFIGACDSQQNLWDSVSILPGIGGGQLGPAASFALGNSEQAPDASVYRHMHDLLTTSDLNADGRTDLIASPGAILLSTAPAANRPPVANAGPDQPGAAPGPGVHLEGSASDPDSDWLTFEWRDQFGKIIGDVPRPCIGGYTGTQTFTLTVDDGRGGVSTDSVTWTFGSGGPLPQGWRGTDVGAVGAAGSSSSDGSVFTVTGSGADIWGTADEFQYASTFKSGDFDMTARVASVQHVNTWTKAGLMIRESYEASARHASIFATPTATKGIAFQRREVTGGTSLSTPGAAVGPPVWLRLQRVGDVITGFQKLSDTGQWQQVGSTTLTGLTDSVIIGFAVSSHADGTLATATFDNFTLDPIARAVPFGWTNADIGPVGASGSGTYNSGTFTVEGSGADIWGTDDAFHYVYRQMPQDGYMTVRVADVIGSQSWTKVGLMIRESAATNARHYSLFATETKGIVYQRRLTTGGTSLNTTIASGSAPIRFRITRTGTTVRLESGVASGDGGSVNWSTIDTASFASGPVLIGLAVTSHAAGQLATGVFDTVSYDLPEAFAYGAFTDSQDVGSVGIPGSAKFDGTTYTISGSGADIWGTADAFRFTYRFLQNDGTLIAKVATLQGPSSWTKAGIMVRSSIDGSATHASVFVTPGKGVVFQRRTSRGALSTSTTVSAGTAPEWLKLVKTGNVVSAFISSDGATWTAAGSDTIAFESAPMFGLAITSHNDSALATATVTDVSLTAQ